MPKSSSSRRQEATNTTTGSAKWDRVNWRRYFCPIGLNVEYEYPNIPKNSRRYELNNIEFSHPSRSSGRNHMISFLFSVPQATYTSVYPLNPMTSYTAFPIPVQVPISIVGLSSLLQTNSAFSGINKYWVQENEKIFMFTRRSPWRHPL